MYSIRIRALLGALLLLASAPLVAQFATRERVSVGATAVGLAAATIGSGATQMGYCEGRLETAEIRFRDDGADPAAGAGTLLEIGEVWVGASPEVIRAVRFIRTGAVSGNLEVRCYPRKP